MYLHQYISNDIELFILAWMAIGTVGKRPKIDLSWVVNEAQSKHQTCELSTQIKFLCFLECWRILFEHQKEYLIKLKFWCLEKLFTKILHTILNRIYGARVVEIQRFWRTYLMVRVLVETLVRSHLTIFYSKSDRIWIK